METGYFNKETAKELRIGNIVKYHYNDEWFELEYDDLRSIYSLDSKAYDRVSLTEEWLIKFGFKKHLKSDEDIFPHWSKYPLDLLTDFGDGTFELNWTGTELNFVHQLQNLYFDLTGEYLTVQK